MSMKKTFSGKRDILIFFFLFAFAFSLTFILFASAAETLVGKTVNINTATVEQWLQVPMINKDLAERIIKYRKDNGDFQTVEELLQIKGFTRDMLRKLKSFLLLEGIGGDECTC